MRLQASVSTSVPAGRDTAITAVADIRGSSAGGAAVSLRHELRQVVRVELSKIP